MELKGVYAAIPTPFTNDEVNLAYVERNTMMWDQSTLEGYLVFDSMGEGVHLTQDEKLVVLDTVLTYREEKKIIVAINSLSTKESILFIKEAAKKGVDAALVPSPSYYKKEMSEKALKYYYTDLAEADLPIILDNSGLSIDLVAELSEHERIIGIRDSGINLAQYIAAVPDFSVMAGSAGYFLPSLVAGAKGGILALASIAPWQLVEIYTHYHEGDIDKAKEKQDKLVLIDQLVTQRWGVAALKESLNLIGYFGGEVRAPLLNLNDKEILELENLLRESGILSLSSC